MSQISELSFLSRPRTLEEIANRLGVSTSKAEQFVVKAVESGELLVVSSSSNRNSRSMLQAFTPSKLGPFHSTVGHAVKGHRFRLANSRMHSKALLGKGAELLLKLQSSNANSVQKASTGLGIPLLSARLGKSPTSRRITLLQHIEVLETVSVGPKRFDEIRARVRVSRSSLENLLRKGLLSSQWGPKGVGRFYRITRNGRKELESLRLVLTIASTIPKRRPISLKTSTAQIAV